MPTVVWVLIWVVVIGVVAALAVREMRAGRSRSVEVDRLRHEAVREAEINAQGRGPNSSASQFFGG